MLSYEKEKMNMPFMYQDGLERGNDKIFAIYQRADGSREEYSYNYIKAQSDLLLERMQKAGLKKGDRIAVVSALRPWWFSLSYACLRGNYIMVCIDPGVPALQMQHFMVETETRAVFTTLSKIHLPAELENHIPVFSIDRDFPLMSKCDHVDNLLGDAKVLPEETFYILFSSGTTSENRKAVLLKHSTVTEAIEYGMSTDAGIYKDKPSYTPRECDLMLFPPYHIAGLLCATFDVYNNTKVIMLERLTPKGLVNAMQELKPDNICTVPSMLTTLYKKIKVGYSNSLPKKIIVNTLLAISGFLRRTFGWKAGLVLLSSINKQAFGGNMKGFMIGASPINKTTNKFFLDMGIDVSMAYGLTELGAPLAVTGQGYYPGTTGRVLRHTDQMDIRIVNKDETGRGEVEVRSPYRMISYMNEKDNEGCFTEDGYFRTGDLGYFDKNKCLNICGRIKESIVLRNGEKLLPEEIDSKYQDLDCVKEIASFKIKGEGGCDDFAIAVVNDKAKGIPDDAMKSRVYDRASHIPAIYRPKAVYVIKEMPLSSSHKIQRFRLTEMAEKGMNEPVTDASMIPVDEDEITTSLRQLLCEVDGVQWKTAKLSEGMLLNLDSLTTVNLYVAIQEKWGIDLFQSSSQPDTFGQLLELVKNFDVAEKNQKEEIDFSQYPKKVSAAEHFTTMRLLDMIRMVWRVKGYGMENLPKNENYLLCANHRTTVDPAFILTCLNEKIINRTCTVGKAELANDKNLGKIVASQNYIPVDRTGNSIKTLERCKELLLEGYNVLIFPEGTNAINNEVMYHFKDGAARLAIATGKPIIPIHISGVYHTEKEAGNFELPPIKTPIVVKFGKPIDSRGRSIEQLNQILREEIEKLD